MWFMRSILFPVCCSSILYSSPTSWPRECSLDRLDILTSSMVPLFTLSLHRWQLGSTPYNGLYREAPYKRGTFFRLEVYKRVGISHFAFSLHGRHTKGVSFSMEGIWRGYHLFTTKAITSNFWTFRLERKRKRVIGRLFGFQKRKLIPDPWKIPEKRNSVEFKIQVEIEFQTICFFLPVAGLSTILTWKSLATHFDFMDF